MKKYIVPILLILGLILTGCTSAADTANRNLSQAAENFEIPRRITAINGITDNVLFTVEGFCSYEVPGDRTFEAICKIPESEGGGIERTTLYLSDNVTFVSSQIGGADVSLFRPRIIFRPETIVPNFDLSTSNGETSTESIPVPTETEEGGQ